MSDHLVTPLGAHRLTPDLIASAVRAIVHHAADEAEARRFAEALGLLPTVPARPDCSGRYGPDAVRHLPEGPEMIQRLNVDSVTDARREALCGWLRLHGGDPDDASLPGWVERDEEARQIRYQAFALDDDGQVVLTPDGTDGEREVHVIQLEAAPLPFPPDPEKKDRP